VSTINEKLSQLEQALTPARRRRVYRLVSVLLLLLVAHKVLTAPDVASYLQALAIALGIAPAELAARNTPQD
jgi:hypothetical protein